MLAERAAAGDWPESIKLPTASGKTACLDAAIFGLAASCNIADPARCMPRRIWFVVDRRIVVDEAFNRAKHLSKMLHEARDGVLSEVAAKLCNLSGSDVPLAVARLRGGAWRDDGWARRPSQPTIICSTVDQVGSALLFRAYGHGDRSASIWAGLAANDSLILLDEAHCAKPFLQTLQAIATLRGDRWAEQPLQTPFRYTVFSATLPPDIEIEAAKQFPKSDAERRRALDDEVLQKRFSASKPTALGIVKKAAGMDAFVAKAAECARDFLSKNNKVRVAVMVNRVATASDIAEKLHQHTNGKADIVLLTGRMRPLDRDDLVERWEQYLRARHPDSNDKPIIVVTTQCLEVGADFSFDALVTECASLDALRQRFGRVNRLGDPGDASTIILIRERDTKEPKEKEADPVYGKAIFETWKWLTELAKPDSDERVDFGVKSMDKQVEALERSDAKRVAGLFAPADDAPVLLPAHLDLLCQTAPRPEPEPDVALFLHGKKRGAPEVRVAFRCDLPGSADLQSSNVQDDIDLEENWLDLLSIVPPTSPEMLTVSLGRLKSWLAQEELQEDESDVQGRFVVEDDERKRRRPTASVPFVIWRGRKHSELTRDLDRIRPDDVVVLQLQPRGLNGLGQVPAEPDGVGPGWLDVAERALRQAKGRVVLRIHPKVLSPWAAASSVRQLSEEAHNPEPDRDQIKAILDQLRNEPELLEPDLPALPIWFKEHAAFIRDDDFYQERHPLGGLILIAKKFHPPKDCELEDDPQADDDDLTSQAQERVPLAWHTSDCSKSVLEFTRRCLCKEFEDTFTTAAACHDLGKLDWRFQVLLHDGNESLAAASAANPLAKSARMPESRRRRIQIRDDCRLPVGFRHEFLSLQLAEHFSLVPDDAPNRDLTLHLVASHHGHARPFAPVVPDNLVAEGKAVDICLASLGLEERLGAADRAALKPSYYQVDSGVADRFWRLTRRYGWWGLAYLEAIFRLGDWDASQRPGFGQAAKVSFRKWPRPSKRALTPFPLEALDAGNPLAFLATLGTLRLVAASFREREVQLCFGLSSGVWRPLLQIEGTLTRSELLKAIYNAGLNLDCLFPAKLVCVGKRGSAVEQLDKIQFPVNHYRQFCRALETDTLRNRTRLDYAAAWAGETVVRERNDGATAAKSRFDFTSGQQALIKMIRELRETCEVSDLERALFAGWKYSAKAVSMRWDPQDEKRQYALQAVDPTNSRDNPPLADLGANFLAIEALPLFPFVPDRFASQPGFDRAGDSWCWPIWTYPIGLDVVRSLLTLDFRAQDRWPEPLRHEFGINVVFRSTIVHSSRGYGCFTPPRAI